MTERPGDIEGTNPRPGEQDPEDDPNAGTLEEPREEDEGGEGVEDPIPDA